MTKIQILKNGACFVGDVLIEDAFFMFKPEGLEVIGLARHRRHSWDNITEDDSDYWKEIDPDCIETRKRLFSKKTYGFVAAGFHYLKKCEDFQLLTNNYVIVGNYEPYVVKEGMGLTRFTENG